MSIRFRHIADTTKPKNDGEMMEAATTENIYLKPGDKLKLSVSYYVIDRDDSKKLKPGDEVKFSVELVDAATNELISSYEEAKFDWENSPNKELSYTLNFKNIKEGNYYFRIAANTNNDGDWYFCDVKDEAPAGLNKNNRIDIDFESGTAPAGYVLFHNYPNPFNPVTKISYSLPVAGFVTLKVYDILGREVATLINEMKSAGKYEVEFDASGLSSGTYIYKLTAGKNVSVRKMLLIR